MDENNKFTDIDLDAFKELSNIGAGHISTSITKFLKKDVGISIPNTKFFAIEEFSEYLGGAENIVNAIYLKIEGELQGQAMFIFSQESARRLVDIIFDKPEGTTQKIEKNSIEESAFKEFGSILSGSFLNAISQFLRLEIVPSIPIMAEDMVQSIVQTVLLKLTMQADSFLSMSTKLEILGNEINGKFVMIFEQGSLDKITDTLRNSL